MAGIPSRPTMNFGATSNGMPTSQSATAPNASVHPNRRESVALIKRGPLVNVGRPHPRHRSFAGVYTGRVHFAVGDSEKNRESITRPSLLILFGCGSAALGGAMKLG